ncbi:sulfite exporter TauE/SafE family protein [Thermodesulfatator autotrophicus]|uniref:Probable membrane transporter protein n=1 Tax=Thermodesulfatator autotrophicus TaxID=1795632 RepID=A0A177EBS9_9BACT|nr:sulfite exporter TauE/SafE family protein [Thermodesulfatator autotrophicus]OAG28459.1 permease [Thermodesulfatator autotrophicus]
MSLYLLVSMAVFFIAFIFSMLGLGGALLYIPIFKWFGFDFKSVAIPTGLFLNGITALSASIYYLRAGLVDIRGSLPMVVASLIGAPIGAYFTGFIDTQVLIILFSIAMIMAGLRMLSTSNQVESTYLMPFPQRAFITAIASFFIGLIAGLLGIGGGFLFVPLLIAVGFPTKKAAATCSFIVVFSSFAGFLGHVAEGRFDPKLLLTSTVAVILGAQLGARFMRHKMKPRWIKRLFGVLLIAVALKLISRALGLL